MAVRQCRKDAEEGARAVHVEIGGILIAYILGIFTPEEYRVKIADFVLKLLTPVIEFFKSIFG